MNSFKSIPRKEKDQSTPREPVTVRYQNPVYNPAKGRYDMEWRTGQIVGFARDKAIVKTDRGGTFEAGAKALKAEGE